jgi:hypothetical protein
MLRYRLVADAQAVEQRERALPPGFVAAPVDEDVLFRS